MFTRDLFNTIDCQALLLFVIWRFPINLSLLAVGFPPKKANTNEVDRKGIEPVSMHKNLSTEKISLS